MDAITACGTCGLIQQAEAQPGYVAKCARCGFTLFRSVRDSRRRTMALSLAALILYFPANIYPIVTIEYWGMHQQTTIFNGIMSLLRLGSYFVGGLVFTTSFLTPLLKIVGLLFLCLSVNWEGWERTRSWVHRLIEIIDPWNMLEVTLLAIVVSVAELGEVATVHPGPGVFSFAAVVVLTIAATVTFDRRLIWRAEKHDEPNLH